MVLYTEQMYRNPQRGFIGLISLLITVAIIGFFVWRSDLFTPKPAAAPVGTSDLIQGSTQIEQGTNAINAARKAKQAVENNYAQQQQEAGY